MRSCSCENLIIDQNNIPPPLQVHEKDSFESENDQGKIELEKAKSIQEELKVINENRNELEKKVESLNNQNSTSPS